MTLRDRRHWIFDLDGTLTLPVHDFDAIRRHLGLPAGEPILEAIARRPPAEGARILVALDALERDLAEASRAQPGAARLVGHLLGRGARVGIVTRNSLRNAVVTLRAIGLGGAIAPEDCVGRDRCPPKPSPAGILRLLRLWRATPASAVMVGDYLFDLQAGRAAGAATVLVGPPRAEWTPWTDVRVDTLGMLLDSLG